MSGLPPDRRFPLARVLRKVRELAEQVRQTADRVHQEAAEAHRLTEIARDHLARGRQLSKSGQVEAHHVQGSIGRSLDNAREAGRRLLGKSET
ncbi:MAG TPA: hypothetical protein VGF34_15265 [Stellaceae bacterium]|jgi:hypothetical protein